ncbi:MAG: imelysin family protein, partial [Myxococcota bacterium]|nr:imelysin family protein [Myxococcota bacterium]
MVNLQRRGRVADGPREAGGTPLAPHALRVLGLLAGLTACACSASPSGATGDTESPAAAAHREVLAALAADVILPTYRSFHQAAGELESAAQTYAESLGGDDREALQDSWREAIHIWQRAEVFQVGPAGSMTEALGGQDMREEIYSWPIANPCRVDQEIVEAAYMDVDAFAEELSNVRGLDALEYLLFGEGEGNACRSNSAINLDGSWQALVDAEELTQRRAAYARTVATLLVRDAKALVDVWEADATGFLAELGTAGVSSTVYPTAQEALNAVSDAMFYLEKDT